MDIRANQPSISSTSSSPKSSTSEASHSTTSNSTLDEFSIRVSSFLREGLERYKTLGADIGKENFARKLGIPKGEEDLQRVKDFIFEHSDPGRWIDLGPGIRVLSGEKHRFIRVVYDLRLIGLRWGDGFEAENVIEYLKFELKHKRCMRVIGLMEMAILLGREAEVYNAFKEEGIDVNEKWENTTLLHRAAYDNYFESIRMLAKLGADLNVRSERDENNTPLHRAANYLKAECIIMLYVLGADITIKNDLEELYFERAMRIVEISPQEFNKPKVKQLLSSLISGSPPLHEAVKWGNAELIKSLLNIPLKDADLNAKDESGKTPLHYALEKNDFNAINLLIKAGANPEVPIIAAIKALKSKSYAQAIKLIETLIALGKKELLCAVIKETNVDINAKNDEGWTFMHEAALDKTRSPVIEMLYELGADINAQEKEALWTPLHIAIMIARSSRITETLLKLGANPNVKDITGRTPLHLEMDEASIGPVIIHLLLTHGADAYAKDGRGETIFDKIFDFRVKALVEDTLRNSTPEPPTESPESSEPPESLELTEN